MNKSTSIINALCAFIQIMSSFLRFESAIVYIEEVSVCVYCVMLAMPAKCQSAETIQGKRNLRIKWHNHGKMVIGCLKT